MTRKTGTVYQRGRQIIIGRVDTTVDGIPVGPIMARSFSTSIEPSDLGNALLEAVAGARSAIPPLKQDDWAKNLSALLDLAGVKSWSTFVRGCRSVDVYTRDAGFEFAPLVNEGARLGFGGLPIPSVVVASSEPEVVGEGLIQAMAAARRR